MTERCPWCGQDPLYVAYHDHEWGVPEWDGRALWEKLVLDGFQAGLSWITILKKRDSFRAAFDGFDPALVANWGEAQVTAALANPGIIRHRGKIEATIKNARAYLAMQEKGDFAEMLWDFVGGTPLQNRPATPHRHSHPNPRIASHVQDAQSRRVHLCRPNHRLCLHAGLRLGQRSPDHLPRPNARRSPCHARAS